MNPDERANPIPESGEAAHRRKTAIGCLLLILLAVGVCAVLLRCIADANEKTHRASCASQLMIMHRLCRAYAQGHEGQMPSQWVAIATNCDFADLLFHCRSSRKAVGPVDRVDEWSDYRLVPGLSTNDPRDSVLIYEPLANHGGEGANVLTVGGTVNWYPSEKFKELRVKDGKPLAAE